MSSENIYTKHKFQLICSCTICKREISVQNLGAHIGKHNKIPKIPNTKICPKCGAEHTKEGTFCSRSCANSRESIKASKLKPSVKPQWKRPPKPIKERICISCGTAEYTKGRFQSEYCKFCNPSLTYRNSCKFTFDIRKYPDEFNLQILETHGMFNPKTNPQGASRDHLLSVDYGKQNKIDPKIISHPANCQIILQAENSKKNNKSSITLNQLLERIKDWDNKYPNP